MMVQTEVDLTGYLTDSLAAGGHLNGLKLHLYSAGPVLNARMAVGDFTEASYTGYAAATMTAGSVYFDAAGNGAVDWATVSFILSAALGTPATILGYYVTNTAGTVLLWAELFAVPKVLQNIGDAVILVPQDKVNPTNSGAVVIN